MPTSQKAKPEFRPPADSNSQFRLLADGITDPFRHFAVEEALLRGIDEGTSPPTVRQRRVSPSVWIGVYQVPEEDVDLEYCRSNDIPVVRRHNPGGAVYQDEGSFCFSLFFRHEELFERLGIVEATQLYPIVAEAVIATCAEYGVLAAHSPTNDCTIGGRKVYGSAQVEWSTGFVHSGTFLVSTDCEVMARALRPSQLKFADKGFTNVRDRVITLSEAVGRPIPVDEVMQRMTAHLAGRLGFQPTPGDLTAEERAQIDRLHDTKYSRPEWTFPQRDAHRSVISTKAPSGVLTLAADLDGDRLNRVEVRGDFLLPRQNDLRDLTEAVRGRTLDEARALVQRGPLPEDVRSALLRLLTDLQATNRDANDSG
ncbi:MAG: lipoate--protein ligase family protein [Thermoleophilia bacterium]|nr:lipoate--protein ligase family protein [Thermoleophilia bacterium]